MKDAFFVSKIKLFTDSGGLHHAEPYAVQVEVSKQ